MEQRMAFSKKNVTFMEIDFFVFLVLFCFQFSKLHQNEANFDKLNFKS